MGKRCSRPLRHTWWQAGQQWATPPRNPPSEHFGNLAPVKGPSQVRSIATGVVESQLCHGMTPTFSKEKPTASGRKKWSGNRPSIKDDTALLEELSLWVCLSGRGVSCPTEPSNLNIPTCAGEDGPQVLVWFTSWSWGQHLFTICFFYPSEWADSVSWWMGPGISTPALLSVHSQGCGGDLGTLTCVCYTPKEHQKNYKSLIH